MNRVKKPSFEKLLDEAIKLKINIVDLDTKYFRSLVQKQDRQSPS